MLTRRHGGLDQVSARDLRRGLACGDLGARSPRFAPASQEMALIGVSREAGPSIHARFRHAPAGSTTVKAYTMVQDVGGGTSVAWFDNVTLTTVPAPDVWTFSDTFSIPVDCNILTVSAGMTIQYGQFEKRLTCQKEIQRGTWANPICRKDTRNLPSE